MFPFFKVLACSALLLLALFCVLGFIETLDDMSGSGGPLGTGYLIGAAIALGIAFTLRPRGKRG